MNAYLEKETAEGLPSPDSLLEVFRILTTFPAAPLFSPKFGLNLDFNLGLSEAVGFLKYEFCN